MKIRKINQPRNKIKKIGSAVVGATAAFVLILFYQNFSYETKSLINYYNNFANECLNNTPKCTGEFVQMTYAASDQWALNPGKIPYQVFTTGPRSDPWAQGFSRYEMIFKDMSQRYIHRNTGSYNFRVTSRNAFFEPLSTESFSFYKDSSGRVVSGPMKVETYTISYFLDPIPNNVDGLIYHILGKMKTKTTPGIGTISATYSTQGLLKDVDTYGVKKSFDYDAGGNLEAEYSWRDGMKNKVASFSNYKMGIAQTITKPFGIIESQIVNNDGNIASKTDGNGYTTTFLYDSLGREAQVNTPSGLPTITKWTNNDLVKTVTRGNTVHVTTYNALGQETLKTITDINNPNSGIYKKMEYDAQGRLSMNYQAELGTTSTFGDKTSYDVLNRVLSTTRTADGATTRFLYEAPHITMITSPLGYKTKNYALTYDNPDQKKDIQVVQDIALNPTSSSGQVVTNLKYDMIGKLIQAEQSGVLRTNIYNSNQLLVQTKNPEKADSYFGYYAGSNLLKTATVGTNPPSVYVYDTLSRQQSIQFADGSTASYEYDKNSATKSVTLDGVSRSFTYDGNGNKTSETLTLDGFSFQFGFTYNGNDVLETIAYPSVGAFGGATAVDRNIVTMKSDGFGRPQSINDSSQNLISNASYHANGMFKNLNYANGLSASLTLTATQWPREIKVTNSSAALLVGLRYTYGLDGNLTLVEDLTNSSFNQTLKYDGLNRLTNSSFDSGANLVPTGAPRNLGGEITYTKTGDIKSFTEFAKPTTTFNYDAQAQYLVNSAGQTTGSSGYSYDQDGQMTSNGIFEFGYSAKKNLASVTNINNGTRVANYTYDGSNVRVKKTTASGTTYYFYVNDKIFFEASATNGTKEYFYLGKSLIATRSVKAGAASYQYYHFNPVYSTVAISNPSGSIIKENYNSFGSQMLANTNFTNSTAVRFGGHVTDDEAGLIYMGARYYDPKLGRFTQMDPADFKPELPQSFNRYIYANNNPHRFVDPDGRLPVVALLFCAVDVGGFAYSAYQYANGDHMSGAFGMIMSAAGLGLAGVAMKGGSMLRSATSVDTAASIRISAEATPVTLYHGSDVAGLKVLKPMGGNLLEGTSVRWTKDVLHGLDTGQFPNVIHNRFAFELDKVGFFADPKLAFKYGANVYETTAPMGSLVGSGKIPRIAPYGRDGGLIKHEIWLTGPQNVVPKSLSSF